MSQRNQAGELFSCVGFRFGIAVTIFVLILFAHFAGAAAGDAHPSAIKMEGFEYGSLEELQSEWKIQGSGFAGSIEARLNRRDMIEGEQCLELLIPPTQSDGKGRLDIRIDFEESMAELEQFNFWLYTDKMAYVFLSGAYFYSDDGDFHRFAEIKNKGEWQKVRATRGQLSLVNGEPSWEKVDGMKFTIWFPADTPANRILIDKVVWDSEEERLPLTTKWYDWDKPSGLEEGSYGTTLIPEPKNVVWFKDSFVLDDDLVIVSGAENRVAAEDLQHELQEVCGVRCAIRRPEENVGKRTITLQIGGLDGKDSRNEEGYTLRVGKDGIVIRSKGAAGVFYGVQTLKQLFEREGKKIVALGCQIRDEPAFAWRGQYLSLTSFEVSAESIELLKRIIDGLAGMKVNTLFLGIQDNMLYDRQAFPKKAETAFSKAQAADLVSYAKERHFEVIPYFQMFTHINWILSNPENVELLEDPERRGWGNNWCPLNPKVEAFVKDILDEAIEVFQPNYCMIGMDEIGQGPFGICERCGEVEDKSELFLKSIMLPYELLAEDGVKTIMFQDSLLPPDGYRTRPDDAARGWTIVDRIPKDVIILSWDYMQVDERTLSHMAYFTDKGFSLLGATFNYTQNIEAYTAAVAQDPKGLGMIGTHWYRVRRWSDLRTISPMVWSSITLQSQYAWNPTNPPLRYISYDTVYAIRRLIEGKESLAEDWVWEPLVLDEVFNGRVSDEGNSWPGYGADNTLGHVLGKDIVSGDIRFKMGPHHEARDNVILLRGAEQDGLSEEPITISVERKARRVAFLHSCNIPLNNYSLTMLWNHAREKPPVGRYRIHYEDGSSVDIELLYRWNIVDWNNKLGVYDGRIAYSGTTESGSRIELIRMDWLNPRPEQRIASITVSSEANEGMSLALFAVSTMN